MIYAYIVAGLAFLAVAGYAKIQHSGKLEAQAKVEACETKVNAMGEQIKQQNAAVDSLKTEADAKAATASKALAKAEGRAKVWDEDAKRLRAILTSRKDAPKDCKAAWGDIRGAK